MKKNFRLNLQQSEQVFRDSICEIKSSAVRNVADSMVNGQIGGTEGWLKAHGDVTWEKGGGDQQFELAG